MREFDRPGDDEQATGQTIAAMRILATADAQAPSVRSLAAELAAEGRNPRETARAIFNWIRRRVQFRPDEVTARLAGLSDPDEREILIRPVDLLAMPAPAGDCDDHAMLNAALLAACGVPCEFVTLAADRAAPETYSHVYTRALLPCGQALAMDTSHFNHAGEEAPPVGKWRTWELPIMNNNRSLGIVAASEGSKPWWSDLATIGAQTGSQIAVNRFGVPPAGTYIQKSDGTTIMRNDPTYAGLAFPGVGTSGGNSSLLLLAGAALVLVLILKK